MLEVIKSSMTGEKDNFVNPALSYYLINDAFMWLNASFSSGLLDLDTFTDLLGALTDLILLGVFESRDVS